MHERVSESGPLLVSHWESQRTHAALARSKPVNMGTHRNLREQEKKKPTMMPHVTAHAYNLSTQEAEAGDFL